MNSLLLARIFTVPDSLSDGLCVFVSKKIDVLPIQLGVTAATTWHCSFPDPHIGSEIGPFNSFCNLKSSTFQTKSHYTALVLVACSPSSLWCSWFLSTIASVFLKDLVETFFFPALEFTLLTLSLDGRVNEPNPVSQFATRWVSDPVMGPVLTRKFSVGQTSKNRCSYNTPKECTPNLLMESELQRRTGHPRPGFPERQIGFIPDIKTKPNIPSPQLEQQLLRLKKAYPSHLLLWLLSLVLPLLVLWRCYWYS